MTVMVQEQKFSNRITQALESVDGIEKIEIENLDEKDVKTKTSGSFEFDGLHYWFYYSENKHLVILEISFIFTFEKIKEKNSITILEAVNNFNVRSTAIKASLHEIRTDSGEVDIEFSYGALNNLNWLKENQYDLEPGISILSYVPRTMSSLFSEKNIEHDVVTLEDDAEYNSENKK